MHNSSAFVTSLPLQLSSSTSSCCRLPSSGLQSVCATPVRRRNLIRSPSSESRRNISMGLFGLGIPEVLVIAGVGVLIFGPSKISELGKDLGGIAGGVKKASAEFKDAMQESLEEADKEIEQKKLEKEAKTTPTTAGSTGSIDVPTTPVNTEAKDPPPSA